MLHFITNYISRLIFLQLYFLSIFTICPAVIDIIYNTFSENCQFYTYKFGNKFITILNIAKQPIYDKIIVYYQGVMSIMNDVLYNLGYSMGWVVPVAVALFCINKIRKNRAEIKRLEELEKSKKK